MKKARLAMLTVLGAAAFLSASAGVELKLAGGIGRYNGADLLPSVSGWNQRYESLGWTFESRLEFERRASDLEAQVILNLSRSLGIGVGAGRLRVDEDSQLSALRNTVRSVIRERFQADVIPLTAFLVMRLPLGRRARFNLSGGAGLHRCTVRWIENRNAVEDAWEAEKKNAIGYVGALSLDFELLPRFALVLEAFGRYLKLEGLLGTRRFNGLEYPQTRIWAGKEDGIDSLAARATIPPTDANHTGWREALIDLTTAGARLGFSFKF